MMMTDNEADIVIHNLLNDSHRLIAKMGLFIITGDID